MFLSEKTRPQVNIRASSDDGQTPMFEPPPSVKCGLDTQRHHKLYQKIHYARIALFGAALATSLAIVGCAGALLGQYEVSRSQQQHVVMLWPAKIDLRPSHTILAEGIVTAVLSLTYLVACFAPLQNKLRILNILSMLFSFASSLVCIFAVIYASVKISSFADSESAGSLISWTCQWQGMESLIPTDFVRICNESTAALDLSILLIVLQVCIVPASAAGWWLQMKLRRDGLRMRDGIELA